MRCYSGRLTSRGHFHDNRAGQQRWSPLSAANKLMNGVVVIDKPARLTSHDVVNRARRIFQERSIGHLGTLDPMATGVLPLVIGRMTRLAQFYVRSDKVYDARVRFGYSTDTYDAAGTATSAPVDPVLDREAIERKLEPFRGEFLLRP